MIEDKLEPMQRVRLEALAQANAKAAAQGNSLRANTKAATAEDIIDDAQKFEQYILNGDRY